MKSKFKAKISLQIKVLVLIFISIMIPLLLVGGCLYYLMFQIMAEQLAIPESIAEHLIPVLQRINFILIVSLPPIIILLFVLGIALTHRFLGPLERLEDDLKKISEGDYSIRIQLRKDDDLKPIADVVNKIIDELEGK